MNFSERMDTPEIIDRLECIDSLLSLVERGLMNEEASITQLEEISEARGYIQIIIDALSATVGD